MKKTDSTVHTHSHLATSLFLRVGGTSPSRLCIIPISHCDLGSSSDVGAAVVLDALVGRLPGTITGAADAVSGSGSAAARPGF